ncbi:MAG TPA: ABC transporter substrate-binding protein [Candidatus Binatia bacterium]|nr:ABC transporter substrate-binding protein [Candidatus Binatia bacterium]
MDEIKIGIGTSSIGRFLPLVGHAVGLFEKAHIAVEIVNQQDEEKVVEDIVAQATPVGTPNAPSLVFSLLNGNDLVIVGGILNRPAFYLAANKTIGGISDIKGKRIGINQPRRMAGMVMLALLRRWRVDTKRDLTLVDFGLNDRSFEALRTGEIDAALLPPEKAFLVETEGFHLVADSLELDCHWVPLATTRRFLAANRDLVKKIALIYAESIRVFKSEPQKTLREIGRWLPALANKPQVLEKCYTLFAERFEPTLIPSLASISSVLDEAALQDPRAKDIEASSLVEVVLKDSLARGERSER